MKSKRNDVSSGYSPVRLEDIASAANRTERLLNDLLTRIDVLPEVDEKGRSACGFAEDLYAQKEAAAEKVAGELRLLRRHLGMIDEEISRCRANLEQIRSDAGRLNRDEPTEHYLFAGGTQEAHYQKADSLRRQLIDVIARAEGALRLAGAKKFPGRKPRKNGAPGSKQTGSGRFVPATTEPASSRPTRPSLTDELDNLVGLGPLTRKGYLD